MTRVQWGAASWILCLLTFPLQFLAAAKWPQPYSWSSNLISDLGVLSCGVFDAGTQVERYICSPAHVLANGATLANGLLLAIGAVLLWNAWPNRRSGHIAMMLIALGGILVAFVGALPWDQYPDAHNTAALLQAVIQWAGMFCLLFALRGAPLARRAEALTLTCLIVSVSGFALFILALGAGSTHPLGLGTSERIAFDILTLWGAGMGLLLLKTPLKVTNISGTLPKSASGSQPITSAR
ncbi:hypothetical protein CQ018_06615 [Arthrobacter sp. MYb227]|uniref:DUF998 domain-containing protein n=1 Tax=Arthrobacter sp. MYb227 TaxID=1848601 RepID=UPI000CFC43EE|nr:DUF998 domain-containing protein [Arthrobacter sp. MYb227]PQZ95001.1 hypothetical protein CQ018_06615 [Arthrobacter sp. MYb227]